MKLATAAGFAAIATLSLPESDDHELSQYGQDKHHYTIFGDPEELMSLITSIRRIP